MANLLARSFLNRSVFLRRKIIAPRNLSTFQNAARQNRKYLWVIVGGTAAFTAAHMLKEDNQVYALKLKREDEKPIKLTSRERRFIKFSSVEYNGQLYMTPLDFLSSVVDQEPRPRLKRRKLSTQEVNQYMDSTPALSKGSKQMFRNLRDKGIISYTEYLFLLSVLTKPVSGFRIAFNMFDTDGNQRVDKNEFLVILTILSTAFKEHSVDEATRKVMERIFSGVWKEKRKATKSDEADSDTTEKKTPKKKMEDDLDNEGLIRRHKVDTTLLIHFFGKKGSQNLNYTGFYKFMDNLQTEVLELEFSEFSKGNDFITELDFAKILLRYTYLDTDAYELYLDRLLDRVKAEKGITFNEFRDFCRFLNNLEDFAIAMRMYTLADRAISKSEFSRAVLICTGYTLTKHLIDTVFAIFDEDGDGLLSYKEFIAIMKDRLHRGFRVSKVKERLNRSKYPSLSAWRHRIYPHC